MAENLGKWPSGHRKTEKSGHRMAAEGIQSPWRWYGGTISTDLDVIWGMSVENPVGQPVVAHELPDVLHGVQLGRPWRQEQKRDVGRDRELARGMPSGLVCEEDGVGACADLGRDFVEMPLHGLGVAAGQDEGRPNTERGTDGAKDIGRLRALVLGRPGPGSPWRPAPSDLVLLADPRFVLPPEFYLGIGRERGSDRLQRGGKVFLKSSIAHSFCAV